MSQAAKKTHYLVGLVLLGGCASDPGNPDVPIGPPRTISIPVTSSTVVNLRIPVGEVRIKGVPGSTLSAQMTVECPSLEGRCAKRLANLNFVSHQSEGRLRLAPSERSSRKYRGSRIRTTIELPMVDTLNVKMTAGELDVDNIQACLHVDMMAGEVDIAMPKARTATVTLDAGVGDASLQLPDGYLEAQRAWLIGAELAWRDGPGDCDIDVDLQAGDIAVQLRPGQAGSE